MRSYFHVVGGWRLHTLGVHLGTSIKLKPCTMQRRCTGMKDYEVPLRALYGDRACQELSAIPVVEVF